MSEAFNYLSSTSEKLITISQIKALLFLDQETNLPSKAIANRASQTEYLSLDYHAIVSSADLGKNITKAKSEIGVSLFGIFEKDTKVALVRELEKEHLQAIKVSKDFISKKTKLDSESYEAWKKARAKNDWNIFAPFLEKQVEMSKEKAGYLGYQGNTYDYFVDIYEPESTVEFYQKLFSEVKEYLIQTIPEIVARQKNQTLKN